ncbi:helix-turn-helix domain-containing protein [Eilatimonas milleporae]|uniref:AraC family transcriptional regulator n=1 Tax=Eilatimonas milleporae TaxID=911205 RepID=A0A3M0C4K0_9PROT|nr:AraC family transcriptional regulator [Eilatimonas milleporae]RMB02009.1 AraC family transcriptional regulator [Eilatimonas milleporae]
MTQQTASSLAEFYTDPASPYAAFPQEHRSGGSLPVTFIQSHQEAFDAIDPAVPQIALVVAVEANVPFRWDTGDGWSKGIHLRSGDMSFVPQDTAVHYELGGPQTVFNASIPAAPLGSLIKENTGRSVETLNALTGAVVFRDETVRRTAMQMWVESARSGGASDLLMDGLTQVLIARLLDKSGALRKPQPILLLSPAEITRIDTLVEHRLAERLTVEDLARTLDMPRWTFADAFKATTGDTPHSYVTGKRVEKACELLRLGEMPIAEIAYTTGFASQSHMTDTFRRVLGTTPGRWREEVRQ